jgi:hypothetical protein
MSFFACPVAAPPTSLQPGDGLHPASGERLSALDQHPQHLQLRVDRQDSQVLRADRGDRDRVRVVGVALPAVTGVQQPSPGRQLGRHVDHVLTRLQQPLRQRPADTVRALDRPHP